MTDFMSSNKVEINAIAIISEEKMLICDIERLRITSASNVLTYRNESSRRWENMRTLKSHLGHRNVHHRFHSQKPNQNRLSRFETLP